MRRKGYGHASSRVPHCAIFALAIAAGIDILRCPFGKPTDPALRAVSGHENGVTPWLSQGDETYFSFSIQPEKTKPLSGSVNEVTTSGTGIACGLSA